MPREDNVLADELTNENFEHFSSEHRLHFDINENTFPVLFTMMAEGKALLEALEDIKKANRGKKRTWPKVARNKRLRVTDPW